MATTSSRLLFELRTARVFAARHGRDDRDIAGRRGMQHARRTRRADSCVSGNRLRIESVRRHAAKTQHVAIEREDVDEVIGGGHERRRRAGRSGGVHHVPHDGFVVAGCAFRAETEACGIGHVVGFGRHRQPGDVGPASRCRFAGCPLLRRCGDYWDAPRRCGRALHQAALPAAASGPRRQGRTAGRFRLLNHAYRCEPFPISRDLGIINPRHRWAVL